MRVNTIKSDIKKIKSELDKLNINYKEVLWNNNALILENATEKDIQLLDMYENGEYPKSDVEVTTKTTGAILFTTGVQYQEVREKNSNDSKFGNFKIVISAEFANFCQKHAVPIDYTVYKKISSTVGKDIYAWLVFRNNGLTKPTFIPRDKLVEQFMPTNEDQDKNTANVNYAFIINQIKEIKKKYYPEVKIDIASDGSGITLHKSPTPVLKNDTRYALITSNI